ncbi:MAG: MerR family DNA-binding transcriptional regulator [Slackia sp.]
MKNELLSIGEVSRMKGVSPKSLRYYEQLGILTPARVTTQWPPLLRYESNDVVDDNYLHRTGIP